MTYRQQNQILRRRRAARRQQRHRRGVLLLVVLSMLVLFMMIGTAFLMTSDMYRKGSKAAAKEGRVGNPPRELLDRALYQLLRDTNNQFSVVRYHSLLRDMYGTDGFEATVYRPGTVNLSASAGNVGQATRYAGATSGNTPAEYLGPNQGQLIDIYIRPEIFTGNGVAEPHHVIKLQRDIDNLPELHTLPLINGYYNGTLLTFTSGPARGQSARVLKYTYETIGNSNEYLYRLQIMAIPRSDGQNLEIDPNRNPELMDLVKAAPDLDGSIRGHSFIVNGRPYNGTGVGYDPTAMAGTPRLSMLDARFSPPYDVPVALAPNAATYNGAWNYNRTAPYYGHFSGLGGCDESYDAPDFQNMFLAHETVMPLAQGTWWDDNGQRRNMNSFAPNQFVRFDLENLPIPSFHRMALVNYWYDRMMKEGFDSAASLALKRKIMMRPLREDHPNFDGSNPQSRNTPYWEIVGPWDVDNDNDGVPDSIFVDLGDPVQQAEDGTLYKPLYAIKIIDLDSRLNLNAHGSASHFLVNDTDNDGYLDSPPVFDGYQKTLAGTFLEVPVENNRPTFSNDYMPHGIGYGTPEISLRPVFPMRYGNQDDYQTLLLGRATTNGLAIAGRYGFGNSTQVSSQVKPGANGRPLPNDLTQLNPDRLAQLKFSDYPRTIHYPRTVKYLQFSFFRSPPDLMGRYAGGLDHFGQPVSEAWFDYQNLAGNPISPGSWGGYRIFENDLLINSPYELDLSSSSRRGTWDLPQHGTYVTTTALASKSLGTNDDAPFATAELERILRAYDSDVGTTPNRLWELVDAFDPDKLIFDPRISVNPLQPNSLEVAAAQQQAAINRRLVTTDSYDLPVPGGNMGGRLVLGVDGIRGLNSTTNINDDYEILMGKDVPLGAGILDLLQYRIQYERFQRDLPLLTPLQLDSQLNSLLQNLLDPDIVAGHRMDLNRPFGNGQDDNGNGMIDEPAESDVTVGKQRFARDLYVLMMLLMNEEYLVEPDPSSANDEFLQNEIYRDNNVNIDDKEETLFRKLTARRIAQWAINCADFRDADAIMTPFEYDETPFDGWDVDEDPSTDEGPTRGLVWGAERPELLITETFAYHDRRCTDEVESDLGSPDLDHEKLETDTDPDEGPGLDDDLDQLYQPRGALFVELYNPWTSADQPPAEFYTAHPDFGGTKTPQEYQRTNGVELDRLSGRTSGSPVWRMVVVRDTSSGRLSCPQDPTLDDRRLVEKVIPTQRILDLDGFDAEEAGERIIYFVQQQQQQAGTIPPKPQEITAQKNYFVTDSYKGANLAPIKPGRYGVIGPSGIPMSHTKDQKGPNQQVTGPRYISEEDDYQTAVLGDATRFVNRLSRNPNDEHDSDSIESARRIELRPSPDPDIHQLLVADNGGREFIALPGQYRNATRGDVLPPCVAIPIEGLNISEPLEGYQQQEFYKDLYKQLGAGNFLPTIDKNERDSYGEVKFEQAYDTPFDLEFDLVRNGTTANYRRIHLQRLANPLKVWNETTNPYLTVDSMSVDLTAFNGMSDQEEELPNQNLPATVLALIPPEPLLQSDFYTPVSIDELAAQPDDDQAKHPKHIINELLSRRYPERPQARIQNPLINEQHLVWMRTNVGNGIPFAAEDLGAYNKLHEPTYGNQTINKNDNNPVPPLTNMPGAWGWHRLKRLLPDKEITFGGRQGDFQQRMHLKSLERGSHHRHVYKTAQANAGWCYDPAWEPRLLWKQEPPNRTIVFGRKKYSGLTNVLDGNLLRNPDSNNNELTVAEVQRNQKIVRDPDLDPKVGNRKPFFDFVMEHTLGFMNESFAADMNTKVNTNGGETQAMSFVPTMPSYNEAFVHGVRPVRNPTDEEKSDTFRITALNQDPVNPSAGGFEIAPRVARDNVTVNGDQRSLSMRYRPAYDEGRGKSFLTGFPLESTDLPSDQQVNQQVNQKRKEQPITPENEGLRLKNMLDSTFPAFPWNNRPFVSQMELLQVPASSSSMLLRDYSVMNDDSPNPYSPDPDASQGSDLNDEMPLKLARRRLARQRSPYGHLLNFLQTTPSVRRNNQGTLESGTPGPNYHRLLEFVHVPSRFINTETFLNPVQPPYTYISHYREPGRVNLNTVSSRRTPGVYTAVGQQQWEIKQELRIWSDVYDGITHRLRDEDSTFAYGSGSHFGPAWRDVALSRRGYATNFDRDVVHQPDIVNQVLNPYFPTFFANPFRAPDAGDLVPLQNMVQPGVNAGLLRAHPLNQGTDRTWGNPNWRLGRSYAAGAGIGADQNEDGLLNNSDYIEGWSLTDDDKRSGQPELKPDGPSKRDLNDNPIEGLAIRQSGSVKLDVSRSIPDVFGFVENQNPTNPVIDSTRQSSIPLFSESFSAPHVDAQRNPHFFYQPLTRLGNLTTTRSGVFAVWITVAYFEVEPAPAWNDPDTGTATRANFGNDRALYDQVYPEGYQLGQEVGIETGDMRRHRGFYIVDRTLPVGFKPGEDLNVENMIRLRRRIE